MKKWAVGTKIWFVFYTLCQWLMFIEFITKPITATEPAYQRATVIYGIVALFGTALILWLALSHKKSALNTMLVIAGVNALINLLQSGFGSMLLGLILPFLNWLIVHKQVEEQAADA